MSRQAPAALVVGGTPRVDLAAARGARAVPQPLACGAGSQALVVGVAVVTGGAIALTTVLSMSADAALAAEQQKTQDLLAQQLEFVEVTQLKNESIAVEQADWSAHPRR